MSTAVNRSEFEWEVIDLFKKLAITHAFGHNPPPHSILMEKAVEIVLYLYENVYTEDPNTHMNRKINSLEETRRLNYET